MVEGVIVNSVRVASWSLFAVAIVATGVWLAMSPKPDKGDTGTPDPVQVALQARKPTVAEFGSNRCHSCKQMKVVLVQLIAAHGDRVGVVEIDLYSPEGRGSISRYRIQMMPTQIFFDAKGQEIGRHVGPISIDDILASLGLDAQKARGSHR